MNDVYLYIFNEEKRLIFLNEGRVRLSLNFYNEK